MSKAAGIHPAAVQNWIGGAVLRERRRVETIGLEQTPGRVQEPPGLFNRKNSALLF